ncbi:MAG: response regulator [Bdellovibrionales bacterium]|nr:response regulator [Bdellovibrionales bacterium]
MTNIQSKRILIIEDDIDIRELIAEILTEEGYLTTTAENGKLGLDYLLSCKVEERPDCIILDLMMPVMTGIQVLESLQLDHPNDLAKIPVIIATAKGNPKEDLKNMPSNVTKIRKPMDVNELIDTVAKHSGRNDAT